MLIDFFLQGLANALTPLNIAASAFGLLFGTILAAIPGLTATIGVALIIPLTYALPFDTSMITMLAAYKGGFYGGSISAILLNIPGAPANAPTTMDGHPLAAQGKAGKALKVALLSSWWGEMFSDIIAVLFTIELARLAVKFGPAEYTMLVLFALTMVGSLSGKAMTKGLIAGSLGVIMGIIGTDPMTGMPRFDFDVLELSSGVNMLAMLIGLLALSQMLVLIERGRLKELFAMHTSRKEDSGVTRGDLRKCAPMALMGSVVGTIIGILPGLGGTTAAYLSYDLAKRLSRHPEKFGTGVIEGVAVPEAANNAVNGGALITTLGLGIPGDVGMAVLMGAFIIHGVAPGPSLIREHLNEIATILASLFVGNALMLLFYPLMGLLARVIQIRKTILVPILITITLIGSFSIEQSTFNILEMILFGVLGYFMIKFDFSIVAMIIGFVLGPILEKNLRRALVISHGHLGIFFSSPIAIFFGLLALASILLLIFQNWKKRNRKENTDSTI